MAPKQPKQLEPVASFRFPHEAHLARARLENAGLEVWIFDEHQVGMQWHLADALGGVKVAVRGEDAAHARALLASHDADDSDAEAALGRIEESGLPAAEREVCPRCRSESIARVHRAERGVRAALATLVGMLVGAASGREVVEGECATCGYRWRAREMAR